MQSIYTPRKAEAGSAEGRRTLVDYVVAAEKVTSKAWDLWEWERSEIRRRRRTCDAQVKRSERVCALAESRSRKEIGGTDERQSESWVGGYVR